MPYSYLGLRPAPKSSGPQGVDCRARRAALFSATMAEDFRAMEASMVKKLAKHVKKQGIDASLLVGWTAKVDGRDR